jgi:hypothetical protein
LNSGTHTFTLLLTACIQPTIEKVTGNSRFRMDALVRLKDYENALCYWLQYEDTGIVNLVFIENSGYDLSTLREVVRKENKFNRRVEFIQVVPEPIPEGLHYGYSELEMIDAAMENSSIINDTTFFIKVTGRLYFPELSKLLSTVTDTTKFIADSRDYQLGNRKKQYVITTLLVINRSFYKQKLMYARRAMQPSVSGHFETLYYQILKPLEMKDQQVVLRFPFNVNPVGYGAHWNVNYNSFSKRIESVIRGIARYCIPWIRI